MKNHQKGKDHGHPRQEKIRRDVVQDQGPEREGEAGQGHVIKDEIEEMGTEIEGTLSETGESQSVTGGMTEGSKGQGNRPIRNCLYLIKPIFIYMEDITELPPTHKTGLYNATLFQFNPRSYSSF